MKLLLHKINQGNNIIHIIFILLYLYLFIFIISGVQASGIKQKELKVEDALVYLDQVSNIDIILILF